MSIELQNQQEKQEQLAKVEQQETLETIFPNEEITLLQELLSGYPEDSNLEKDFLQYLRENPHKKVELLQQLDKEKEKPRKKKALMMLSLEDSIKTLKVGEIEKATQTEEEATQTEGKKTINQIEREQEREFQKRLFLETRESQKSFLTKHAEAQPSQETLQSSKQSLQSQGLLDQLQSQGFDQTQIDEYISFHATKSLIEQNPQNYQDRETQDFLKSLGTLERSVFWSSPKSFTSPETTLKISGDLLHKDRGNESVKSAFENNSKQHADDYESLFNTKSEESNTFSALSEQFWKFFPAETERYTTLHAERESKVRSYQEQVALQGTSIPAPEMNQHDIDFLDNYKKTLQKLRGEYTQSSMHNMELMNTMAPVIGLANYLDFPLKEGDADLSGFIFDQNKDISMTQESITFRGEVQGRPFALKSDLSKPSPLQTSSYFSTHEGGGFQVGNEYFQDSKYIMPDKADIRNTVKNSFQQQQKKLLENSTSMEEYQKNLQSYLFTQVNQLYGAKDLVKIRMEKEMQKSLAAQETVQTLGTLLPEGKSIEQALAQESPPPEVATFRTMLNKTLQESSPNQLAELRLAMQEFGTLLAAKKQGTDTQQHFSPIIAGIDPTWIENTVGTLQGGNDLKPNILDILNANTSGGVFNIAQFKAMLRADTLATHDAEGAESLYPLMMQEYTTSVGADQELDQQLNQQLDQQLNQQLTLTPDISYVNP